MKTRFTEIELMLTFTHINLFKFLLSWRHYLALTYLTLPFLPYLITNTLKTTSHHTSYLWFFCWISHPLLLVGSSQSSQKHLRNSLSIARVDRKSRTGMSLVVIAFRLNFPDRRQLFSWSIEGSTLSHSDGHRCKKIYLKIEDRSKEDLKNY